MISRLYFLVPSQMDCFELNSSMVMALVIVIGSLDTAFAIQLLVGL